MYQFTRLKVVAIKSRDQSALPDVFTSFSSGNGSCVPSQSDGGSPSFRPYDCTRFSIRVGGFESSVLSLAGGFGRQPTYI